MVNYLTYWGIILANSERDDRRTKYFNDTSSAVLEACLHALW